MSGCMKITIQIRIHAISYVNVAVPFDGMADEDLELSPFGYSGPYGLAFFSTGLPTAPPFCCKEFVSKVIPYGIQTYYMFKKF